MTDTLHTFVYGLHEGDHDYWYVGMTTDPDARRCKHLTGAAPCTASHITPDTQLHVLDEVTGTLEEVRPTEQLWIDGLRAIGYPLVNGDDTRAYQGPRSDETRRKISAALQGRTSPRKGVVLSDETRRKLKEAATGRSLTDAHRAAISAGVKARKAATA